MSTPDRRPLTRQLIVETAVETADDSGLDALSMRSLAAAIGCKPMSLYRHVDNRDDLIAEMVDRVYAEIPIPPPELPWRDALRDLTVSARRALVRHHWASALLPTHFPGPMRRRHMEALLRVLATADLPADVADLGFHALTIHAAGSAMQQVAFETGMEALAAQVGDYLATKPEDTEPHLVAHFGYHARSGNEQDDFAFVLELILDGLERAARPPSSPAV